MTERCGHGRWRQRRGVPSVAAVALAALLVACSASTSEGGPTEPTIALAPNADPFTSALIMTRTWAAADLETVIVSTIDGVSRVIRGRGQVAIDKGYGDIAWTSDGVTGRELVNDRAIFTQPDASGGNWTRTDSDGHTPTSAFANPLLRLTELRGVTSAGTDGMQGFEADRYRGTLPVTEENLQGLALTDAEIARIVEAADEEDAVIVTVWADPNRRLVRIDRALDLGSSSPLQASVLASTHLWNFGVMLDLESPPSASVTSAPS